MTNFYDLPYDILSLIASKVDIHTMMACQKILDIKFNDCQITSITNKSELTNIPTELYHKLKIDFSVKQSKLHLYKNVHSIKCNMNVTDVSMFNNLYKLYCCGSK